MAATAAGAPVSSLAIEPARRGIDLATLDPDGLYREAAALFLEGLPLTTPGLRVPACPSWDVHDLVAHQVHQLQGACSGTFPIKDALDAIIAPQARLRREAVARQTRWIDAGLRVYRARPLDALVEEWTGLTADAPPAALAGLFPDVAVHFYDLLGAAQSAAHRDHRILAPALRFWAEHSAARLEQAARGPVRLSVVRNGLSRDVIGDAQAAVVVEGTAFELLRAMTGRRTRRQACASLCWINAPDAFVDNFSVYGWRSVKLLE